MKYGNLIITDDEMGCVVRPWIKSTKLYFADASTFIPTIIIIPFIASLMETKIIDNYLPFSMFPTSIFNGVIVTFLWRIFCGLHRFTEPSFIWRAIKCGVLYLKTTLFWPDINVLLTLPMSIGKLGKGLDMSRHLHLNFHVTL